MKVTSYRLFAKSELAYLQSQIENAISRCLSSWSTGEQIPVVRVSACDHEHHVNVNFRNCKWSVTAVDDDRWVAISEGLDEFTLAVFLAQYSSSDNGSYDSNESLANKLVQVFLSDLADSLIQHAQTEHGIIARNHHCSMSDFPCDIWKPGSGAICVEITMRDTNIILIVSAELTLSYLSRMEKAPMLPRPVTSIRKAMDSIKIEMNVGIGHAELNLGEFQKMMVGDVIRLNTKLAQPVKVFLDNQIACTGFLTAYRGNKSLLLKSLSN